MLQLLRFKYYCNVNVCLTRACCCLFRDILLELLSSDDTMARRAAAEGLALMGLKVGDGYAVYLIQVRSCTFSGYMRGCTVTS